MVNLVMQVLEEAPARPSMEMLFADAWPVVLAFVERRLGRGSIAEDVTAGVFVEAVRRHVCGDDVEPAWLMMVARRRVIDQWRRWERQRDWDHKLLSYEAVRRQVGSEPESVVLDALSEVCPRHRVALVARYIDGKSVAEVAEALDLSYKATESLLARARTALGEAYDRLSRRAAIPAVR